MKFETTNETKNFSFEDCTITNLKINDQTITFEVEALIVLPNNSQNTNYTESYAGTTVIRMTNAKILTGKKDGVKYYDANDVLLSETPDEILTAEQLQALPSLFENAFLFCFDSVEGSQVEGSQDATTYRLNIELATEEEYPDPKDMVSYELEIACQNVYIGWDVYLNKVQR